MLVVPVLDVVYKIIYLSVIYVLVNHVQVVVLL